MTTSVRVITMALLTFGLGITAAFGQTTAGVLRKVEQMSLDIAPLDEDSETCGITRGRITDSIRDMTADAPFKLGGDRYILTVRMSSIPKDGECFSSVDIGVYYRGALALPGRPEGEGKAVLWENGTILISPRSQHWPEVENIMKHLMRGLVADWRSDNLGSG